MLIRLKHIYISYVYIHNTLIHIACSFFQSAMSPGGFQQVVGELQTPGFPTSRWIDWPVGNCVKMCGVARCMLMQ